MVFKGVLSNSTIDFGADNDSLTFSVGATSTTILGGAGDDTLVFTTASTLRATSIGGGGNSDSLVFSAAVTSNTSIGGGGGADTMVFNDSVGTAFVSLDSGSDSVSFVTRVSGATMHGGSGAQTVVFSGAGDLITFTGKLGGGSINGGSGDDTLIFSSVPDANVTSISGGIGDDSISGSISVGSSGISFWGGTGSDTFDFGTVGISGAGGAGGTAYFWNDSAGDDNIILSNVTALTGAGVFFGITEGSGINVSFGAAAVANTTAFGAGTMSSTWRVHNNVVSFGFDTSATQVTMVFAGGSGVTLQGGVFDSAVGTGIFTNVKGGGTTGNFGITGAIPTFS
jgi:hypothetical protein